MLIKSYGLYTKIKKALRSGHNRENFLSVSPFQPVFLNIFFMCVATLIKPTFKPSFKPLKVMVLITQSRCWFKAWFVVSSNYLQTYLQTTLQTRCTYVNCLFTPV